MEGTTTTMMILGMDAGLFWAFLGAIFAIIFAGMGSAMAVGRAGETSAGVVEAHPEVSGQAMVLQLLPGTQGIYGFLIGVIVLIKLNVLGGSITAVTAAQGLQMFMGCLPIAVVGLISALFQGRVACCGINMLATRPGDGGKAILMTVMVETYAVLALLASVLMVWFAF